MYLPEGDRKGPHTSSTPLRPYNDIRKERTVFLRRRLNWNHRYPGKGQALV